MLLDFSLKDVFADFGQENTNEDSHIDQAVQAFFQDDKIDFGPICEEFSQDIAGGDRHPWSDLDLWREVLTISLLALMRDELQVCREACVRRVRNLLRDPLWEEMQLASALATLSCHFLDIPHSQIHPYQLAGGAAPVEWGEHWSWAAVPHAHLHAELGLLWALLAQDTDDREVLLAADRLARWQLNTLDGSYLPFVGFFVREEDADLSRLLVQNYLLFHAVALLTEKSELEYIADRQLEHLWRLKTHDSLKSCTAYDLVVAAWLEECRQRTFEPKPIVLDAVIYDRDMAVVGCRTPKQSVVCTLAGGGSGMGAYHAGDLQVVSFGPQRLPLGDCLSFGIEGLDSLLQLEVGENNFTLAGRTHMAAVSSQQKTRALFRHGQHSGVWMDVKHQWKEDALNIEASFLSVEELENLAFAFFVKAPRCQIGEALHVRPLSLDRYQGQIQPVSFIERERNLIIAAHQQHGEMQIIPLAGNESFWGADFLVAYILDSNHTTYQWTIRSIQGR